MDTYLSFHAEWFLRCSVNIKHFPAFDMVGLFCTEKRGIDEIDVSSSIEYTCGSAHGCSVNSIDEEEPVHRLGTYGPVPIICCKWKRFAVAYR